MLRTSQYTVQFSADLIHWVNSTTTPGWLAADTEIDVMSVPYPPTIETTNGTKIPQYFRVSVSSND